MPFEIFSRTCQPGAFTASTHANILTKMSSKHCPPRPILPPISRTKFPHGSTPSLRPQLARAIRETPILKGMPKGTPRPPSRRSRSISAARPAPGNVQPVEGKKVGIVAPRWPSDGTPPKHRAAARLPSRVGLPLPCVMRTSSPSVTWQVRRTLRCAKRTSSPSVTWQVRRTIPWPPIFRIFESPSPSIL